MATNNRAALFAKAHKILKKHYQSYQPPERTVLDHLLYACCLENAHYEQAEKAFEALKSGLFDWNEVRVSTVRELAETMPMLPNAMDAANNLRKILFAVFESHYSYDLEGLKKQNLGAAQQKLHKYRGVTRFVLGYVTQATLDGHCIPLDRGSLQCLDVLVGLGDKEKSTATVAGLERAIPKNKGIEFGSLLHELGADMMASPHSTNLHKILLEINPEGKDRLPKRHVKKEEPAGEKGKSSVVPPGKKPVEPPKPLPGKSLPTTKPGIPSKFIPPSKPNLPAKPIQPIKPSQPAKPAPSGKQPTPSKPLPKKEPLKESVKKSGSSVKRKPR